MYSVFIKPLERFTVKMIRTAIFQKFRKSLELSRFLSAQHQFADQRFTDALAATKFQEEWQNAKSFEQIPGMSKLEAMFSFFFGGEFNSS